MNGPITCFKYRTGAAALRALSEGTAYFAPPHSLNDSLEAKFDVAAAGDFSKTLYKTIAELARKRGHLGDLSFVDREVPGLAEMTEFENKRFEDSCRNVGIFSSATRPDNQPMWAYYCDNLHGVCFHLEWSEEILRQYQVLCLPVTYSRQSRVIDRAADLCELLCLFEKENPSWSMSQIMEFSLDESFRRRVGILSTAKAVATKHADWEHENELRLFKPNAGPIPVMQEVLKSVIFSRTDFPEWGSIMMLLHRLYPNVELVQMSFEHTEPFVKTRKLDFKLVPISS